MSKTFKKILKKHGDLTRYIFVGGFNTILDIALFSVFSNILDFHIILANVLSTIIVLSVSFFLNYYFVFRSNQKKLRSAILFVCTTLFNGWVVQSIVIWLVAQLTTPILPIEISNIVAKICGVTIGAICNYLEYRLIFKDKPDTTK